MLSQAHYICCRLAVMVAIQLSRTVSVHRKLFIVVSCFLLTFKAFNLQGLCSLSFVLCSFFQVSTLVQVVGIIICLHAATRISHRAQGVVSLASRWHAMVTCTSSDASQLRNTVSTGSFETSNHLNSIHIDYSESDLESLDYGGMSVNTQLVSYMSSHQKRQAFGT